MKIIHISTNYTGGAGKAAFRLHNALLRKGIDSKFLSLGDTPLTDCLGNQTSLINTDISVFNKLKLKFRNAFLHQDGFKASLEEIRSKLECNLVSLPISNYLLSDLSQIKNADIINLHGVQHLLDYTTFFEKAQQPIVWTLHDINPISGLFHLRTDEVKNKEIANELNQKVLNYKKKCYKKINNGAIITPSKWLRNEAINRNVFDKWEHYQIPNLVAEAYYSLRNSSTAEAKETSKKITLLFISSDIKDTNKGVDLFLQSLNYFDASKIKLHIVGKGNFDFNSDFETVHFGYVADDESMIAIYKQSDILILPSRDENLPNVLLESLFCGTPVVSFKVGGMQEYIIEGFNGELAEEMSGESLSFAIKKAIKNSGNYSREAIISNANDEFNEDKLVAEYCSIYQKLY